MPQAKSRSRSAASPARLPWYNQSVLVLRILLSVAVAGEPALEVAASSPAPTPVGTQELMTRARAAYDAGELEGAIDLYTQAYAAYPDTPVYAEARGRILLGVAAARVALFDARGDREQLRLAKAIVTQVEGRAASGELRAEAGQARASIVAREPSTAPTQTAAAVVPRVPSDRPTTAVAGGRHGAGAQTGSDASRAETLSEAQRLHATGGHLRSWGQTTGGLGGLALLTSIVAAITAAALRGQLEDDDNGTTSAERRRVERKVERARHVALGSLIAAGTLLPTGLGLSIAGTSMRARAGHMRRTASAELHLRWTVRF